MWFQHRGDSGHRTLSGGLRRGSMFKTQQCGAVGVTTWCPSCHMAGIHSTLCNEAAGGKQA